MPAPLTAPRHRRAAPGRRPGWLAAGAVVLAAGVLAVVLLTGGDDDPPPLATPLPPPIQTVDNGAPPPPATTSPTRTGSATGNPASPADVTALRQLAKQAADSVNQRDLKLARNTYCQVDMVSQRELDTMPPGFTVVIAGEPVVTGDRASIPAFGTLNGQRQDTPIPAKKEQGRWCVDGTEDRAAG